MKRIFDPIVERIEELVSEQVMELRMDQLTLEKWDLVPKVGISKCSVYASTYHAANRNLDVRPSS